MSDATDVIIRFTWRSPFTSQPDPAIERMRSDFLHDLKAVETGALFEPVTCYPHGVEGGVTIVVDECAAREAVEAGVPRGHVLTLREAVDILSLPGLTRASLTALMRLHYALDVSLRVSGLRRDDSADAVCENESERIT